MDKVAKGLLILFGILIVLGGIVFLGIQTAVNRPQPDHDDTITVQGLTDEVTIYRAEMGVPRIYASNDADAYFAQGYVTAQDRFWQMEWWRHQGQGRLAEIIGDAGVPFDEFIRTAGWNRMAEDSTAYMMEEEPEFYDIMLAYSAGVNAYIGDKSPSEISVNHTILGMVYDPWEIEPWEPMDTISWGVVMSFVLADDVDRELAYAEMIADLGEDIVFELRPEYPYDSRPVIAPTDEQSNALSAAAMDTAGDEAINWQNVNMDIIGSIPEILGHSEFVGSNNWVIGGEHTASGQPLLANDPHLAVQMPAIWYEVALHAPQQDVIGFSFAGVPGVVIGHNEQIAWGVTNSGPDVLDLFIEKVNPDNPNQYEWMGEWQDMEIIDEVIKVNGGEDIHLPVRITRHGPVISDVQDDQDDVLAMRWAAQEPTRVMQAVVLLDHAQNYEEFRDALRYWDIPSQNFVYADQEGNIAYQMPGRVPSRKNGQGMFPVPGWTGEYEWEGWVDFDELPALFNPEKGYVVTANHAVVDEDYPYYIKRDWANGDRGFRIEQMIDEALSDGVVTMAEIELMQMDSMSMPAITYIPLIAPLESEFANVQVVIDDLADWTGQERRDSYEATLFELFYRELPHAILDDDIGAERVNTLSNAIFLHEIANDPNSAWWDNADTPEVETRDDILLQTVEYAVVELSEVSQEDEPEESYWALYHHVTFASQPLGESGINVIEKLVNRGPYPVDGGRGIVNANGWSADEFAAVNWHPSMRMIIDMADYDASVGVIPTGQSGHPGDSHYDDQIALWVNGDYIPFWWTETAVKEAAVAELKLQP